MMIPSLLYAGDNGEIFKHSSLKMSMNSGGFNFMPYEAELTPLPDGSNLYFIPGTVAMGFDMEQNVFETVNSSLAVSASLPSHYLRLFSPSYSKTMNELAPLAYTAAGWMDDTFAVSAMQIDEQQPSYTKNELVTGAENVLKQFPNNTLFKRVTQCSIGMGCPSAKNMMCQFGEFVSICLRCVNCHMDVIRPDDLAEAAIFHAKTAENPVITFTESDEDVLEVIKKVRTSLPDTTVNFYLKSGSPKLMKQLISLGVDSVIFHANTFHANTYPKLHQNPFEDLCQSLSLANKAGKYVSMEMYVQPGVTDRRQEVEAAKSFLHDYKIDLMLLRNMKCDPEILIKNLELPVDEILGVKNMLKAIKKEHKHIMFGAHTRSKKDFYKDTGFPDLRTPKYDKNK